jgi:hypothetical protein
MAELARRQVEGTNLEHTNILRWEDDGGKAIEYEYLADHPTPEGAFGNPQPMTPPAKEELERMQRQ